MSPSPLVSEVLDQRGSKNHKVVDMVNDEGGRGRRANIPPKAGFPSKKDSIPRG